MAYLEKFKVKGRTYYKLVHNIREGDRISHRVKYLGKSLPPRDRLKRIELEFLEKIKGERYKYLSREEVNAIEKKRICYIDEIKRLSPLEKQNKMAEFIVRFTYDSSKLAGVDVTLRQTSLILREGIIPQDFKNLKTVKELENHEKGIIVITKYKGKMDMRFIKKLHKILMSGVDDSIAGRLRSELKRNVKLTGTTYIPPKWENLNKEIENFFKWYKSENRRLHPIELSALLHLKIISMQPFVDGNSRLSRLLMNWVLWKKSYPLIDIPIEDLEKYYRVLDSYQIEKREQPFIEYLKEKYLKS